MDKDTRLKLAVQKSGRLTDPSLDLLWFTGATRIAPAPKSPGGLPV